MSEKQNPAVGDKVMHNNGYLGEVIGLGTIATNQGLAVTYNIKFLEGPFPGVNWLRQEFTFPIRAQGDSAGLARITERLGYGPRATTRLCKCLIPGERFKGPGTHESNPGDNGLRGDHFRAQTNRDLTALLTVWSLR